jgi:hypothetical protein
MCDVPSIAVFCSESVECFPGTASKFFFIIIIIIIIANLPNSYGSGAFPANLAHLKCARVCERDREEGVCSVIHKFHLYVSEATIITSNPPVASVTCQTGRENTAAKHNG